jgi:hypothetical protein
MAVKRIPLKVSVLNLTKKKLLGMLVEADI